MLLQNQLIVVSLDDRRFGIALGPIQRVIPAVEITPLPDALPYILGAINVQGQVVPVLNARKMWSLPGRDVEPDDQLVLIHGLGRLAALPVDRVEVVECDPATLSPSTSLFGAEMFCGALRSPAGLIPVCDIEAMLEAAFQSETVGVDA